MVKDDGYGSSLVGELDKYFDQFFVGYLIDAEQQEVFALPELLVEIFEVLNAGEEEVLHLLFLFHFWLLSRGGVHLVSQHLILMGFC